VANSGIHTRKRVSKLRWRGVLCDSKPMLRRLIGLVLAVASAAFTFTQLGFIGIPMPNGPSVYITSMLIIVALSALLLGTVSSMAMGLFAGVVLYLHSLFMPLDHYELLFVNPLTSIVMLCVCGLLLGLFFAIALKNNPQGIRRIVYIAIACLIVSFLYSIGFAVNSIILLFADIVDTLGADVSSDILTSRTIEAVLSLGDIGSGIFITAAMMIVVCCVGDKIARFTLAHRGALGLRTVFLSWLSVVMILAFLALSASSFAVTTLRLTAEAEKDMASEVNYLAVQISAGEYRDQVLGGFISTLQPDDEAVASYFDEERATALSDHPLLDGYTVEEDGTIFITFNNLIYSTNDDRYELGSSLEEYLDADLLLAAKRSQETGQIQRFVYSNAIKSQTGMAIVQGDVQPQGDGEPGLSSGENAENAQNAGEGGVSSEAQDASYSLSGFEDFVYNPQLAYLYSQTISPSDSGLDYEQAIIMIRPSSMVFANRNSVMGWTTLSSLVLFAAVFVLISLLLNRVVARRIDETNEVLARVTAGDLDARVEVQDTREFESLSEGVNTTVDSLKNLIVEAETRMDEELATARAIQESALPQTFPPFPNIPRFDIYASMNPAKQVGGDFYDFFLIGDDCGQMKGKLGFLVADVSGKGVPAALFMMKAKALLRDYVSSGMELGEAISEVNRQLVDGNDESMFVTAWVGVLDYGTGHVDYVNAGHNPPLLWQNDDGWRWMREKSGPVLGLFEVPYSAHEVECNTGDMLLLYTDGVTEAFDVNAELYGEERLLAVAEKGYRLHPSALLESVKADVAQYAEGAEQSDDITILALEVGVPPEATAVLEVPAELTELDTVNEFLHAELDNRFCPHRVQSQLDIAVEELFVNVCKYAYAESGPDVPRTVRIHRTYSADPSSITVDIIDKGIPFDPLAKPDAVTPDDIKDVPIGGLGILMAKKSVDEIRYERTDGNNIVTIVKKW